MGASKPSTAETDRILGGLLASQSSLVGKVQVRERLSQRKWMMVFLLMTHLSLFFCLHMLAHVYLYTHNYKYLKSPKKSF